MVIAIDGPSGAGKSTLGKSLARALGYLYIDSGALYRAVGFLALDAGVPLDNTARVAEIARIAGIRLTGDPDQLQVVVDGVNVTERIRLPDASAAASIVATIPEVREAVVDKLRLMSIAHDVVMDGRDIGTRVFPSAGVKLFVSAGLDARAERRWKEDSDKGREVTLDEVKREIAERDQRDTSRSATPLVMAENAILIDTSDLSPAQVTERALEIVRNRS